MTITLIAIAKDASTYDVIQNLLSAHGAIVNTAEAPTIVIPKNMAQAITFAEQIKPIILGMKMNPGSSFCAKVFEVELNKSLTT